VWVFDPVAATAIRSFGADVETVNATATTFAKRGIAGVVVVADGRLWHAGGATEEQELGVTLATFVSHLRLVGSAERIGIALAVDSDQFRSMAKLRAIRLLLARVIEVAGLTASIKVHAETSWRSLTTHDPDINLLRATSAAFAAAVGGANSLTVLPFDSVTRSDSGLARRLARNTQLILADEANLARVADPGAGSGAIEALTAGFAEAAWKRFQAIEADGGILAAIAEGSLLREVAEAREARLARVSRADIPLIGVNAFRGDATTATVKRAPVKRTGPLSFRRLSEPFEAIS
jgi:methylmalonyl-CoA mutase